MNLGANEHDLVHVHVHMFTSAHRTSPGVSEQGRDAQGELQTLGETGVGGWGVGRVLPHCCFRSQEATLRPRPCAAELSFTVAARFQY